MISSGYLIGILVGIFIGTCSKYFADKYTDRRRNTEKIKENQKAKIEREKLFKQFQDKWPDAYNYLSHQVVKNGCSEITFDRGCPEGKYVKNPSKRGHVALWTDTQEYLTKNLLVSKLYKNKDGYERYKLDSNFIQWIKDNI